MKISLLLTGLLATQTLAAGTLYLKTPPRTVTVKTFEYVTTAEPKTQLRLQTPQPDVRAFGTPPAAALQTPPAKPFFGSRPPAGLPYFGEPIVGAPPTEPTTPQIPRVQKKEQK